MCQYSVQLFLKFRKRNTSSQGYSRNNAGKQFKGTTQLKDQQDSVNFIIEKFQEYNRTGEKKSWRLNLLNGLEEEFDENTDQRVIYVLSESMGETISSQDIYKTYKFPGKKPNGKSWPVK